MRGGGGWLPLRRLSRPQAKSGYFFTGPRGGYLRYALAVHRSVDSVSALAPFYRILSGLVEVARRHLPLAVRSGMKK